MVNTNYNTTQDVIDYSQRLKKVKENYNSIRILVMILMKGYVIDKIVLFNLKKILSLKMLKVHINLKTNS